ncbi:MAG: hypothetical protein JOS17DRAFT_320611 [Linnemannia elongata]|nr:MAG: hypothetical protein JOS17DRAFT_320611 [Linnemannia elongata]
MLLLGVLTPFQPYHTPIVDFFVLQSLSKSAIFKVRAVANDQSSFLSFSFFFSPSFAIFLYSTPAPSTTPSKLDIIPTIVFPSSSLSLPLLISVSTPHFTHSTHSTHIRHAYHQPHINHDCERNERKVPAIVARVHQRDSRESTTGGTIQPTITDAAVVPRPIDLCCNHGKFFNNNLFQIPYWTVYCGRKKRAPFSCVGYDDIWK